MQASRLSNGCKQRARAATMGRPLRPLNVGHGELWAATVSTSCATVSAAHACQSLSLSLSLSLWRCGKVPEVALNPETKPDRVHRPGRRLVCATTGRYWRIEPPAAPTFVSSTGGASAGRTLATQGPTGELRAWQLPQLLRIVALHNDLNRARSSAARSCMQPMPISATPGRCARRWRVGTQG
jgi:hypothetical protein